MAEDMLFPLPEGLGMGLSLEQPDVLSREAPAPVPEVVDNMLIEALIWVESRNDPDKVSPKGAIGPAQIMPETARDPGFGVDPVADPRDPVQSRRFVRQYLTALIKRYNGELDLALMAYNWGPGNVDKWVANGREGPVPRETREYTPLIHGQLDALSKALEVK